MTDSNGGSGDGKDGKVESYVHLTADVSDQIDSGDRYECSVPGCDYSTDSRSDFAEHWNSKHE